MTSPEALISHAKVLPISNLRIRTFERLNAEVQLTLSEQPETASKQLCDIHFQARLRISMQFTMQNAL